MKEFRISKIIFLGLLVFIFSGTHSFTGSAESLTPKENDEIRKWVNLDGKTESEQIALIEAKIFELNQDSMKNKDQRLLLLRKRKEISLYI